MTAREPKPFPLPDIRHRPFRRGQGSHVRPTVANDQSRLTKTQARLLSARERILEDRTADITYQHTVFCQTSLPYRDPGSELRIWEREQGQVSLSIEAGRARHPDTGEWVELGLPFGPKARLILMDLNQRALQAQSPTIDVGDSMTAYLARRLDLDTNGRNIRLLKDQLSRLSTALVRLAVSNGEHGYQVDAKIVTAFDLWFPKHHGQRMLWPSTVRLSEEYFQSLIHHAVPLCEHAIAALSHSAVALDLYTWLAQRLHRVPENRPQFIRAVTLKDQFGVEYSRVRDFRRFFGNQLRQVATVYPDARLEFDARGLTLHNSPPPIRKIAVQVTR